MKPALLIAAISCVVLLIGAGLFALRNNTAQDILGTWVFSEIIDEGDREAWDGAMIRVMTFLDNGVIVLHDDETRFNVSHDSAEYTYEVQSNGTIRIWLYRENCYDAKIENGTLILQGRNSFSWLGSDRLVRKP